MQQMNSDLWDVTADALCITTNGMVKRNGECVMGRGCAQQARDLFPGLAKSLGTLIREKGNHVHLLNRQHKGSWLVSFPVKHNWWERADLDLIKQSVGELITLTNEHGWDRVTLPRPGCGNGGLKWEEVEPLLEPLDDRFIVVTW